MFRLKVKDKFQHSIEVIKKKLVDNVDTAKPLCLGVCVSLAPDTLEGIKTLGFSGHEDYELSTMMEKESCGAQALEIGKSRIIFLEVIGESSK